MELVGIGGMAATTDVGELIIAGDAACRSGDLQSLGAVAQRLAELAREPLHCELVPLARKCAGDPDGAADAWMRLKHAAWTCLIEGCTGCAAHQARVS